MTLAASRESANALMRGVVLTLTFVLSCALGLLTPYLLAVIGIVTWAVMLVRGTLFDAYRSDRAAQLFLVVFLGMGLCFAVTAEVPQDVIFTLNFIMLVLYAPLAALMRNGADEQRVFLVADLALAGTVVAFVAATLGAFVFNWQRAESPIFGAILLANTALILGFLTLIGVVARGRRTSLYLLAPVLAIVVIALTGSRGPLLAVVPLALAAAVFVVRAGVTRPVVAAAATIAFLLVSGAMLVLMQSRSASIVTAVTQVLEDPLRGGKPQDAAAPPASLPNGEVAAETANIRLELWKAGYAAFLERPITGHGWARLMESVKPHLPAGSVHYAEILPQLHNDVVNFAVAAGVVGVALYLLLLVTPLLALIGQPRDSTWIPRLYGVLVLTIAYFFDGMTDLMFGFEFHTAFFICVSAVLLNYLAARRG